MSTDATASLTSSLDSLDVPYERAAPEDLDATLADHCLDPAVAAPLEPLGVEIDHPSITVDPTPAELKAARTGITHAAFAIADYGSLVVPTTATGTELVSLFVDRHVVVVRASDVVPDMPAAFDRFGETVGNGESAIVATGPSATADMGALVRGAHGPEDVHAIVLEDDHE